MVDGRHVKKDPQSDGCYRISVANYDLRKCIAALIMQKLGHKSPFW